MRVPITLAVIDGFAVGVAEDTFVIPLGTVLECLDAPDQVRAGSEPTGLFSLRGAALPYIRLRSLFGRTGPLPRRKCVRGRISKQTLSLSPLQ